MTNANSIFDSAPELRISLRHPEAHLQALLKARKSKMLALIPVARRLLAILNEILTDRTSWQSA